MSLTGVREFVWTSVSFAAGQPPGVVPSLMTRRLFVVSMTASPAAPVKAKTWLAVPRRS